MAPTYMKNLEWADLPFAPAKAYGTGRDGKSPMYEVLHFTAGSERSTSAEDGAEYDQRRTDGVSTHFFYDQNSVVQCVYTWDRANAAFHKGNRLGNQHEICGTQQTRAQWLDPASDATLWNCARQVARDCVKYGFPVRRLTPDEVRASWYSYPNGPRGICDHAAVTLAYPEDGGTHMDVGSEFPWDVFLPRVQMFVDGGDMALSDDDILKIANAISGNIWPAGYVGATAPKTAPGDQYRQLEASSGGQSLLAIEGRISGLLQELSTKVDILLSKADLTPEELGAIEDAAREGASQGQRPSHEELVQATFEGAQQAERE